MNLFSLFPPPDWLIPRGCGIDVSDRSLKFVEFKKEKNSLRLKKFGSEIVENGVIEGGEIKRKDAFTAFLKKIRENYELSFPAISLPEEKAFLSLITLPAMEESRLKNALALQIEDYIPLTAENSIFDFEISSRDPETGHLDVLIVAFPKKIVEDYAECFEKAGFNLLVMELESLSAARVFVPKNSKKNIMLVDFGKTRTTFAIVAGGHLRFTSTVELGGRKIDEAISRVLNIDIFKAEGVKRDFNFIAAPKNQKIMEAVLPIISSLKEEIEKYFAYWINHFSHIHQNIDPEIKEVIFYGGDANMEGFCEYLSQGLRVPVKIGNPWTNIISFDDYVPEIQKRESLAYAVAIGLGLRAFKGE